MKAVKTIASNNQEGLIQFQLSKEIKIKNKPNGAFRPYCLRGHERKDNILPSGHCMTCVALKKAGVITKGELSWFKPSCKYGHKKVRGIRCQICKKGRVATPHDIAIGKERNWKNTGLKNKNGDKFSINDFNFLMRNQGNKCGCCGVLQSKLSYLLNVDHNHKTHVVRGLLCTPCNWVIGLAKDSHHVFDSLVQFLEKNK